MKSLGEYPSRSISLPHIEANTQIHCSNMGSQYMWCGLRFLVAQGSTAFCDLQPDYWRSGVHFDF